jgi:hypothetical protein
MKEETLKKLEGEVVMLELVSGVTVTTEIKKVENGYVHTGNL